LPFTRVEKTTVNESYPRNMLYAEIQLNDALNLNVFNVHGIWGKHGADTDRRRNMINIILDKIGHKPNVVLSGDFNLNENVYSENNGHTDLTKPKRTEAVSRLEKQFTNVFKDERITSFNPRHKDFISTGYGMAVVDMVFVSPNIKVLSHSQPEVNISDHMPQICELQVN